MSHEKDRYAGIAELENDTELIEGYYFRLKSI
jgi:hypothetical protein